MNLCKDLLKLKTSHEWLKDYEFRGYAILDPDGWDRTRLEQSMNELINKEEFQKRLTNSTLRWKV